MANFKQKILNTLKNNKNTDNTLNYLSNVQNNLIKNYSNRVFTNSDKNKLLEKYGKVENLGKAIYKHNALKENNINAEKEEENVSNLVLKGGVSNFKYVWCSENSENTCEECAALDGTEYSFEDEVPERPHPNCQCWVEIIENDNTDEDEEPCDCIETVNEEISSIIDEVENVQNELSSVVNELLARLKTKAGQYFEFVAQSIIDKAAEWDNAIGDFARNYNDMVEANTKGADKYFHSKANCEATQRGGAGEVIAEAMSLSREITEGAINVIWDGKDLIEQIEDANKDMEANEYGRIQGTNNPDVDCEILIDVFRPRGLPEKY